MTPKLFALETLTIIIGVIVAELVIDAIHQRRQGSLLDGNG